MISFAQAVHKVQHKLGDEDCKVWTRPEVEGFVKDAYDQLCSDAKCLFDMVMFDDQPMAGNYTRPWEKDYMRGMVVFQRFGFTREFEREYVDANTPGPVDHTTIANAEHVVSADGSNAPSPMTVGRLPEDYIEVARVTHDKLRIEPEFSRALRLSHTEYQTLQGGVYCYSMDQDGFFSIRRVGVATPTISAETVTGTVGGIRQVTSWSMDQETVIGTYGGPRSIPRHFPAGYQYGGIRRILPDDNATRVEYFRLGRDLEGHGFEVPDRTVKYIEWYAMYLALKKPGSGQDIALANHFKNRYQVGLDRVKNRVKVANMERTLAMGGKRASTRDQYLERFPGDYGYPRPFRR